MTANSSPANPSFTPRRSEARAYSIVASVLVMIGGLLVPFIGWMVGIAMVWASRAWTKRQKWIATLVPLSMSVLGLLLTSFVGIGIPGWMGALLALPAAAVTGVWLLLSSRSFRA